MLRPRRLRSRVPASHHNRASASIWSPQNPESMPQDSLTHAQLGIPDSTPPESALGVLISATYIFGKLGGLLGLFAVAIVTLQMKRIFVIPTTLLASGLI